MNPKVSVIIPTYKRPHLIRRAIRSVLNQTYQNFKIIVIDDSPDDKTEKTIKELNDKRIKYIRNQIRRGFVGAKNQGVEMSSPDSKYIAFLDDDDEYLPIFLKKGIKKLEGNKELIGVTSLAEMQTHDGKFIARPRYIPKEFWKMGIGNGWIVRRSLFFEENFWFDEKCLFEDLDLGARALKNHKWECFPEVLMIYHSYPTIKGESHSTSFTPQTPSEEIDYFYRKNLQLYRTIGRKAIAWVHFITGKTFCRAKKYKEGRHHLLRAVLSFPRPEYILYYLLALFFPKAFEKLYLIVLKHKIKDKLFPKYY